MHIHVLYCVPYSHHTVAPISVLVIRNISIQIHILYCVPISRKDFPLQFAFFSIHNIPVPNKRFI